MSSTLNSSWKLMRPIRATASRLVRARAETHIVIKTVAMETGTPNISKKPATPRLKIWNGVPVAGCRLQQRQHRQRRGPGQPAGSRAPWRRSRPSACPSRSQRSWKKYRRKPGCGSRRPHRSNRDEQDGEHGAELLIVEAGENGQVHGGVATSRPTIAPAIIAPNMKVVM